ncbi:hypothetical protein HDU77_004580 [Chytriomyces hyalinus]|nr:hypothetical protein HDU77_004580 [Chytriomyces hyalinus]
MLHEADDSLLSCVAGGCKVRQTSMLQLTAIPTELLQEIFSWTHPEYDLIQCQRLCKSMHRQLSNQQFLKTNFQRYLLDLVNASATHENLIDQTAVAASISAAERLQEMEHRWFKWPELYQQVFIKVKLQGTSELQLALSGYKNGKIPSSIQHVGPQLRVLNLSNSSLQGEIPASIGALTGLQRLNLSHNLLEGVIPATIGHLRLLTHLDLSANRLSGCIPESIGNLSLLKMINASNNRLTGPLPLALFQDCSNLEAIQFEVNLLDGSIPHELIHTTNLKTLDLRCNRLTGTLPAQAFTRLQCLESLDVSYNQLQGTIPTQLGPSCPELKHLNLSHNLLTGEIPVELWDAHQLRSVYLKQNQLYGELSGKIGNCTRLSALSVSNNALSGKLPPELGECRELSHLMLSGNQFEGIIPKTWETLEHVGYFDLGGNPGLKSCEGLSQGSGWKFQEVVKTSNSRFPQFFAGLRGMWSKGFFRLRVL